MVLDLRRIDDPIGLIFALLAARLCKTAAPTIPDNHLLG